MCRYKQERLQLKRKMGKCSYHQHCTTLIGFPLVINKFPTTASERLSCCKVWDKIYILAARQQQCVCTVFMSGCQGVWDGDIYYCKQIYGFLLLFWIPTICIILLLLGFMTKDSRVFSKKCLQHSTNFFLYHLQVSTCCLITDTTSLNKMIVQMSLSIKTRNFDTNIFGITLKKFEACKESLSVSHLLLLQSSFLTVDCKVWTCKYYNTGLFVVSIKSSCRSVRGEI
jgi:hypothetical protein